MLRRRPFAARAVLAHGLAGALLVLLLGRGASPVLAAEGPAAPVERLEQAFLAAMEGGLDFVARYKRMASVVAETHDITALAARRSGADLASFSEEDGKAVRNVLFKRLTARYAVMFAERGGRSFTRQVAPAATDGSVVVTSTLAGGEGARVELAFTLAADGERWRIRGIRVDGKDEAAAELETNRGLLAREGVRGLIAAWERWIPRPSEGGTEATRASDVVKRVQDELLAVMKAGSSLDYAGRFSRLAPVIDETHHLPGIAQLTIRRGWGSLTEPQQRQFVEKFRQLSIARYASRFDSHSGERFEVADEKDASGGTLVRSALVKSNGERIQFDYLLRQVGGRWRILNITVDGVSDLATKQAEYGNILSTGGFAALLAKVEEQIRRQEAGG